MELFQEYNAMTNKIFQVMDNEGKIINPDKLPELPDDLLKKAYSDMLFARTADLLAVNFQRQGRMYTYPPNNGQEAISVAAGLVMKEEDWLVPAFRELGAYLAKGVTLKDVYLSFIGNERGVAFSTAKNITPMSVPIATQLPHAVGIGYAIKYRKEKSTVFAFVGDGGTSEGDFHEALNFAGVWKVPVIFIVQNNQFAISLPVSNQTASESLAVKSVAYGIPGIKVDGNDLFALYSAFTSAKEYTLEGKGPVLIEALTFRKGAHTTSDDPTKYRTKELEEEWDKKDPLKRLKLYLLDKGLWTEEEEIKVLAGYKKEAERQFEEAENYTPYSYNDVFDFMYVDMPDDLKNQKVEYEKFLAWQEKRKTKQGSVK